MNTLYINHRIINGIQGYSVYADYTIYAPHDMMDGRRWKFTPFVPRDMISTLLRDYNAIGLNFKVIVDEDIPKVTDDNQRSYEL